MMNQHTDSAWNAAVVLDPAAEWYLYGHGHVLSALIVRDEPRIEARILLDGQLLYRSRHATMASAAAELGSLRGRWTLDGWQEPS
jgi:hypothetical protein